MDKQSIRIVYMGTPDFAVESLRALVEGNYNVVAVVTMPDKPAGRGHQLQSSAVKQYALSVGLPVLQPERLKDEAFLQELRSYQADLQIVVAFRMLPEVVWNMPPLGTFNLHASLLPKYRGAAPINWAVINGELQTGVTTFKLKHEIDTGDILMQQAINILPEDNAGTIHDKLMYLGGELLLKTVRAIENGESTQQRQSILAEGIELRHAPKIFKEDMRINWNDTTNNIHNKIRGLSPHPAAWTEIKETTVKIFRTSKGVHNSLSAGEIKTDNKNYLEIGTADGAISIEELQMAGKKKMNIKTFLMGCKF